eukprot:CAMPEP_0170516820 /NCGR_PEP_ID=MMETSP0209-20121228/2954_1 /TAXON_ID=665100 ORGANISM="Litonotus pictus, Strain P1" /NCGR_SAMPLE_ID=MMETSP0209 /ASSEMBLY_ACC=CAM_ASM_000301 /LENGTH=708 /DNA_ID=CAMNT_0010801863 /DNA_START=89 /DNA_END=2218 /DNA_ORIENTATION=+
MAVLLILLVLGFGGDFFKRTNPLIIKERITPLEYKNWTLRSDNNIFPVRLEDKEMNYIDIEDSFYINIEHYQAFRGGDGQWLRANHTEQAIDPCSNLSDFAKKALNKLGNVGWLCPNLDGYNVGGSWDADSEYISFFKFKVYVCLPGETNNRGVPCSNDIEKTYKYLSDTIFFTIMIPITIISPSNYDHGLNQVLKYVVFKLDKSLLKELYFELEESVMDNDYGWIIQTSNIEKAIGMARKDFEVSTLANLKEKNLIGKAYLNFNSNHDKYSRTYTKLQDLAAQVGGIFEISYVISSVIVSFYTKFFFHFEMASYINPDFIANIKEEASFNNRKPNLNSKSNGRSNIIGISRRKDEALSDNNAHHEHPKLNAGKFEYTNTKENNLHVIKGKEASVVFDTEVNMRQNTEKCFDGKNIVIKSRKVSMDQVSEHNENQEDHDLYKKEVPKGRRQSFGSELSWNLRNVQRERSTNDNLLLISSTNRKPFPEIESSNRSPVLMNNLIVGNSTTKSTKLKENDGTPSNKCISETKESNKIMRKNNMNRGHTPMSALSLNHVNYLHNLGKAKTDTSQEEGYGRIRILELASSMKELRETLDHVNKDKKPTDNLERSKRGDPRQSLSSKVSTLGYICKTFWNPCCSSVYRTQKEVFEGIQKQTLARLEVGSLISNQIKTENIYKLIFTEKQLSLMERLQEMQQEKNVEDYSRRLIE